MPSGIHLPFSSLRLPSTLDGSIRRSCRQLTTISPRVLTNSAYIKTGASLLDDLSSSLSTCPSDYYVVVHQPGVHSTDFSTRKSAPRLGAKMLGKDKSIRSKMSVNEVAGLLEAKDIQSLLEKKCKAQTTAIDGSCKLPLWPLLDVADTNPGYQLTCYEAGEYPSQFESGPRIIDVEFPMLSLGSDRAQQLSDNGTQITS